MCYTIEESLFKSDFCKLIQQSVQLYVLWNILYHSVSIPQHISFTAVKLAIQEDDIPILNLTPVINREKELPCFIPEENLI